MTTCKSCGNQCTDVTMVKGYCHLCILKNWPPKNRRQIKTYEKAVVIALNLGTPLLKEEAEEVVRHYTIEKMQDLSDILTGESIKHAPNGSFYLRLKIKMEDEK